MSGRGSAVDSITARSILRFYLTPFKDLVGLDRANHGRDVMTTVQAAALRTKWKQRADPQPCMHPTLELERNDSGSFTGNYHCIVCGQSIVLKRQ
jgi:hypothetical protein